MSNTQQYSFLLGIFFHSSFISDLIAIFSPVKRVLSFLFFAALVSCGGREEPIEQPAIMDDDARQVDSIVELEDSLDNIIVSDYNMSMVDEKKRKDFKENLIRIEKEHGEQWDFCTCAVKKDSAEKALLANDIKNEHFEEVWARSEWIDKKCQAFDVQSDQRTPDQRAKRKKDI